MTSQINNPTTGIAGLGSQSDVLLNQLELILFMEVEI